MKRVLSLILALVMILAMFTMVGAAEGPETTTPAEVPVEPAADTPEVPAEPAPEVTETVTEPAPAAAPTEEPVAEPTEEPAAAPTEEPAAAPTEEPVAAPTAEPVVVPTEEPVTEPVAAPPADNGVATISEPAPQSTEIPEQPTPTPDHRTVRLYANGGYFTGDHAGYDGFLKALVGNMLPYTGEKGKGDPDWYTPERPGYKFLGWFEEGDLVALNPDKALNEGSMVPEGVTKLYAGWEELPRTVTLNANPGYISRNDTAEKLYKDWCGAAEKENAGLDWDNGVTMINVVLADGGNLPSDVGSLDVVRDGWTFEGWYTQPPTEKLEDKGDYSVWETKTNGQQVQPGSAVGEDTQVLYAAYKKAGDDKLVTFYLDWNGINGLWGHCLTCTCPYDDGKATFTPKDALVIGLNYKTDDGKTFEDAYEGEENVTWANLKAFWESNTFNGYKFEGWYTTPDGKGQKVDKDWPIEDGMSFYAHWTKDGGSSSDTFERVDPAAGPLTGLRILGNLDSSMSGSVHADMGATFTLSLFRSPVRAEATDVTWNVEVVKAATSPVEVFTNQKEKETFTVKPESVPEAETKDNGVTLRADGLNLTITCNDGKAYSVTVTAEATGKDGEKKSADSAASVSFYHTAGIWVRQEEPTCIKSGTETTECTICHTALSRKVVPLEHQWKLEVTKAATCTTEGLAQDTCTRCGVTFDEYQTGADKKETPPDEPEVIPATGHDFEVVSTSIDHGMRCFTGECAVCSVQEEGEFGDVNADNSVDLMDFTMIYKYICDPSVGMPQVIAGEVNGDGDIDLMDFVKLYRFISGEIPSL